MNDVTSYLFEYGVLLKYLIVQLLDFALNCNTLKLTIPIPYQFLISGMIPAVNRAGDSRLRGVGKRKKGRKTIRFTLSSVKWWLQTVE